MIRNGKRAIAVGLLAAPLIVGATGAADAAQQHQPFAPQHVAVGHVLADNGNGGNGNGGGTGGQGGTGGNGGHGCTQVAGDVCR